MKFLLASVLFTWSILVFSNETSLEDLLKRCGTVPEDSERLICYDKLTKLLEPAKRSQSDPPKVKEDAPQPVVGSTSERKQGPQLGEKYLTKKDKRGEEEVVLLVAVKGYKDKRKRWVFEFDNGQIWRQIESKFLSIPNTFPVKAKISKGVFGSHNLIIGESKKTIKVMRLQ